MAIKKIQMIPPGYIDVVHPETDSDIVLYDNTTTGIAATTVRTALDAMLGITVVSITTTWTGASPPYTQTIAVAGMRVTHDPIICPVYSTTLATAILQQEAWNMVSKIITGVGSITVYCFEDKPTIAIPIQIKGV